MPPLVVSALGRGGATAEELLENLLADLADIEACRSRHAGRVVIDALEMRVPTAAPLRSSLFEQLAELTASAGVAVGFSTGVRCCVLIALLLVLMYLDRKIHEEKV